MPRAPQNPLGLDLDWIMAARSADEAAANERQEQPTGRRKMQPPPAAAGAGIPGTGPGEGVSLYGPRRATAPDQK